MIKLLNLSLMLSLAGGITLQGGLQGIQPFIVLRLQLLERESLICDVFLVLFSIILVGFDCLLQALLFLSLEAMALFVKEAEFRLKFLHLGQRVLAHN